MHQEKTAATSKTPFHTITNNLLGNQMLVFKCFVEKRLVNNGDIFGFLHGLAQRCRFGIIRVMDKTAKKGKQKIKKGDIDYDTPVSVVEGLYGFKTGFPAHTKFGDVVKKVSPAAADVLRL